MLRARTARRTRWQSALCE